jgi:hypothetical protein
MGFMLCLQSATRSKHRVQKWHMSCSVKLLTYNRFLSKWPRGLRRRSAAAGIAGSNPADGMYVSILLVLCVVR